MKLTELIQDDKNFNKGSKKGAKLMEKSFERFKAGRSILVDKNNRIIAGNKSTEQALAAGITDVIIVETTGDQIVAVKRTDIDLDTPEGREFALADNATAKANIVWAEELIVEEVGVEVAREWEVKLAEVLDIGDDDFDPGESLTKDPGIVLGDLIEIGPHRLLCGSSTEVDTWSKLMGQQMADLVNTDPPYNVAYTGKTKDALTIKNDEMSDGNFYQFLYDFYTALGTYCKPGASWYIWHADSEGALKELKIEQPKPEKSRRWLGPG